MHCLFCCGSAGSSIRLKGRNLTESEHVKLGAYHTLELEPGRSFMLHKTLWDSLDIERIRTATDPQASADLAALLITVGGPRASGRRTGCMQSPCADRLPVRSTQWAGATNCRQVS